MNPQQNYQPRHTPSPYQSPSVQPQYPNQQPKKSNKKLVLAIVIVFVTLLIGVSGYLLIGKDNSQTESMSDTSLSTDSSQNEGLQTNQDELSEASEEEAGVDNLHKNNAVKLSAVISEYMSNNRGKLPEISDINNELIVTSFNEPIKVPNSEEPYVIVEIEPKAGQMQYVPASTCDPSNNIIKGSIRQFAVRVQLTSGELYCTN